MFSIWKLGGFFCKYNDKNMIFLCNDDIIVCSFPEIIARQQ